MKPLCIAILLIAGFSAACGDDPYLWRTPLPDGGSVEAIALDGESAWVTADARLGDGGSESEVWRVDDSGSLMVFSNGRFLAEVSGGLVLTSSDQESIFLIEDGRQSTLMVAEEPVAFLDGIGLNGVLVVTVGLLEEPNDILPRAYELWGVDLGSGAVLWRDREYKGNDQISDIGGAKVVLTSRTDGFGVEVSLVDPQSGDRQLILNPDTWKSGVSGVQGCVLGYREQLEPGADYLYVVEDICESGRQEFAWGEAGWTGLGDRWLVGDGDELIAIDVGGPGATSYLVRVPLEGLNG